MTHEEYTNVFCNWTFRILEKVKLGYQCIAQVKHYAKNVWGYTVQSFWWTAYVWWLNKKTTFKWKKYVEWFWVVPVGSIVIFKPFASVEMKKPWPWKRKASQFGKEWHVAIVDYIDNDWVIRVIEQNWATGDWDGKWWDEVRVRWYWGRSAVAGFILEK